MTNEELVSAIQEGERERLLELWEQVERFIFMQAGRASRATGGYIDAEDLYQSGFLALVAAVESYDAAAGKSFVGWLTFHLKTAFADAGNYRTRRQIQDPMHWASSLDAPISEDEDAATLGDLRPDPKAEQAFADAEAAIFNQQLHEALERALGSIPIEQAETLRRKFYRGQTLAAISAATGISVENTRQRQNKGLRAIRRSRQLRELEQFISARTPYYSGVGLGAFQHSGSQPERLVILREKWGAS